MVISEITNLIVFISAYMGVAMLEWVIFFLTSSATAFKVLSIKKLKMVILTFFSVLFFLKFLFVFGINVF